MADEIAVDIGFDERLAACPGKRHHFRHILAQELAAAVDAFANSVVSCLDAAANAVARLEKNEIDAALLELKRRRQAGEAGTDDDDVGSFPFVVNSRP